MLVEESILGQPTIDTKDMDDAVDESEETLSLCDLPLYSDQSADWDQDLSLASNSMSSSQEDYFEFFSQELNPTAAPGFPPENIIFCGKLIPYKQVAACAIDSSNLVEIKNPKNDKKKRGWRLFRWKFSFSRSSKRQVLPKNGARSTTALVHQSPKKTYNTTKPRKRHGRMSIFTASSSSSSSGKAKWYLLLFGISRFSSVVEMRDIRSRQSRRQCPPSPQPPPPPPPTMFGFQNHDDKAIIDRRWGLWGLIRALSCG